MKPKGSWTKTCGLTAVLCSFLGFGYTILNISGWRILTLIEEHVPRDHADISEARDYPGSNRTTANIEQNDDVTDSVESFLDGDSQTLEGYDAAMRHP